MSDEVTRQAAEASAERNVAREHYDWMVRDRDDWQKRAETAERASAVDASTIQRLTIEVHQLKDAVNKWIAECNRISAERNAAFSDMRLLRDDRDAARDEVEGLRADLLAHPPELHQELAIERKRHLELMEDYDRREVVITTLEEALKRTENMLKTAQNRHIDDRLKGFLAVISQLADQAQDLLP